MVRKAPNFPALATDSPVPTFLLLPHDENRDGKNLNTNTLKENFVYTLKYDTLDFLELFYENHVWKKNKQTLSANNKHTLHSCRRKGFSHFSENTNPFKE